MSNSTTLLDTIAVAQSNKEAVINALLDAASPATLWGRHASACNLLVWGYYGGNLQTSTGANAVANGTLTLPASSSCYIYASATTGAVSQNTTGFPTGSVPLYTITTNATTVSGYTDLRSYAPSATAGGGGGSGTVTSVGAAGGVETDQTSNAAITTTGNIRTSMLLAGGAIKTAAYTYVTGDRAKILMMNSASAVSQVLPTPTTGVTSNFPVGWWGELQSLGAGVTTLGVPSGLYLDGVLNGTVAVAQNQGLTYFTDGTNWYTLRGIGGTSGATTLAALTDVNVTEGSAIDTNVLRWQNSTTKWIATLLTLAGTTTTTLDPANTNVGITLSNGNLSATGTAVNASWLNSRVIASQSAGKWYCEATFTSIGSVSNDRLQFGVVNGAGSIAIGVQPGSNANSIAVYAHGDNTGGVIGPSGGNQLTGSFGSLTGATLGMAVDFTSQKIWFYNPLTSQWNGGAIGAQNPATATGGISLTSILTANGTLYPIVALLYTTTDPAVTFNGGGSAFANTMPVGFSAWAAASTSLIADSGVIAPSDGDLMVYNGAQGKWINTTAPDEGGFVDGNFDLWTLNTTFALAAATDTYTADMWLCNAGTGGAATVSLAVAALGSEIAGMSRPRKYRLSYQQTTAASTSPTVGEKLESVLQYNGQTITVSATLAAAAAATDVVGIQATQNFGTGGSPSATVVTTQTVAWPILTTEKRFSGTIAIPSISGKTLGTAGNDFLRIDLLLATGTTYTVYHSQLQIDRTPATTVTNTTGTGGAPQNFRYRGLAAEKVRAVRYLRQTGMYTAVGGCYSASAGTVSTSWDTPLRTATPSVTINGNTVQAPGYGTGTATLTTNAANAMGISLAFTAYTVTAVPGAFVLFAGNITLDARL